MTQTKAPTTTPSPTDGESQSVAAAGSQGTSNNPKMAFMSAALNMSWQLAIVVLVPVIGGFELDKKLKMLPLLTIVGFILAMVGMALVVWRQLQLNSPIINATAPKGPTS